MPLFDYVCNKCNACWEQLEWPNESLGVCPECGAGEIKRQVSLPGYPVFKGKGFYENDYKRKT